MWVTMYAHKVMPFADGKPKNGLTHAFVVEFDTPEDRDYYVRDDPVHQGFVKSAGPIIEKAIVVDYAAGVFA